MVETRQTPDGSSPLTRGKHCCFLSGFGGSRLIPAHAGKTSGAGFPCHSDAAHPRSRGENMVRLGQYADALGSSPLTRGKPRQATDPRDRSGLIPAHAGKTFAGLKGKVSSAAHPRSRGENGLSLARPPPSAGSSPLTRGKPEEPHRAVGDGGLIPAHAGKTSSTGAPTARAPAHPRSRGENSERRRFALRAAGSSPLTRGKRR